MVDLSIGVYLLSILPKGPTTATDQTRHAWARLDSSARSGGWGKVWGLAGGDGRAFDGAGGEEFVLDAVEILLGKLELVFHAAIKVACVGGLDPDLFDGGETEICRGEVFEFIAEGLEFAVGKDGGALVIGAEGFEEEVF